MENLIKLSDSKDFIYYGVILPKEAENIFLQQVNFQFDGSCEFELVWDEEYRTVSQIYGYYDSPELLGALDNLSEEMAREILLEYKGASYEGVTYKELLSSLIESLGVNRELKTIALIKAKR
jgi:hypothetical protein